MPLLFTGFLGHTLGSLQPWGLRLCFSHLRVWLCSGQLTDRGSESLMSPESPIGRSIRRAGPRGPGGPSRAAGLRGLSLTSSASERGKGTLPRSCPRGPKGQWPLGCQRSCAHRDPS